MQVLESFDPYREGVYITPNGKQWTRDKVPCYESREVKIHPLNIEGCIVKALVICGDLVFFEHRVRGKFSPPYVLYMTWLNYLDELKQETTKTKTVIIFRGLPGSGKSTLANRVCDHVVSSDTYAVDSEGNYSWDIKKVAYYHESARLEFLSTLEQGIEVIGVANTNTLPFEWEFYELQAKLAGYRVHHVIVENRNGTSNVHSVPERAIEAMRSRFDIKL